MKPDPIVEEIRKIKDSIAAKFHYDVRALAENLRKREKHSGRDVVSPNRKQHTA